jgi:iron-sulfur cluster assembly protein
VGIGTYSKVGGKEEEGRGQSCHIHLAGAKLLIDAKAQLTILGTEMDYVESKLSSEFIFNNPNVKGTCGCGESFTV